MKKRIIILLVISLLFTAVCPITGKADEFFSSIMSAWVKGQVHQIEKRTYPFYLFSPDSLWPDEFPLYFLDGVDDLPYMDLNDFAALLNWFYPHLNEQAYADYHIKMDAFEEDSLVILWRENNQFMTFDFESGIIGWSDFLGFKKGNDAFYVDLMSSFKNYDDEGRPYLLSHVDSRERSGSNSYVTLEDYGIRMLMQDGLWLVPLQTLSALSFSPEMTSLYFNQTSLILCYPAMLNSSMLGNLSANSIASVYYNGLKTDRSWELTVYSYHELAMELDYFYGLREAHEITDFLQFFIETNLLIDLTELEAECADRAVETLVLKWLDDGHSTFIGPSFMTGKTVAQMSKDIIMSGSGLTSGVPNQLTSRFREFTRNTLFDQKAVINAVRKKYPEASESYYEVGNTAYVTLDSFSISSGFDYYEAMEKGNLPDDTIGTIIKAHQMINRENSPIENVVLDLSLNTGGAIPAAIFVLGWFLGDATLSVKNTFDGALSTSVYRADVNLDRKFDANDSLSGVNLFCLTSPVSFSCGNLLPWAFKADGSVILLGKTTAGGSCTKWPMSTAWGTSFTISGFYRLSFLKNGAYYDVDLGVEPNYQIAYYEHYYDREALTEFINNLY